MPSGDLFNSWTLAVAVVSVLVAVLGVAYARGALFPPKRRLALSALPPAPLLADESATTAGVDVTFRGAPLNNPHVVTISIESTGRHAVTSGQFDQNRPIEFDLEVPITTVLKSSILPSEGSEFAYALDGSKLLLGPDLLNPRHTLVLQILTDGLPEIQDLKRRVTSPLSDTSLDFRYPGSRASSVPGGLIGWLGAGLAVVVALSAAVVAVIAGIQSASEADASLAPDNGPVGSAVTVSGSDFERFAVIRITLEDKPVLATPSTDPSTVPTIDPMRPSPSPSYVYVDQLPIVETQADKDGEFSTSFVVPPGYPKGRISIEVQGDGEYAYGDQVSLIFYIR